jgi:hypothetical protein
MLDGTIKVEGERAVPKNENKRGSDSSFLTKKILALTSVSDIDFPNSLFPL